MTDTSAGGGKGIQAEPEGDADRAAREQFVQDLVARGEAAYPDEEGKLPPGATHEIVEEGEGGGPTVRRRRFSLLGE